MTPEAALAYVLITGLVTYTVHTAIVGAIDTAQKFLENRHEIAKLAHKLERRSRKPKPQVLETCPLCEDLGVFKQYPRDELVFYVKCLGRGCATFASPGHFGDETALKDWNRGIVYLPDPEPEEKPPRRIEFNA